MTSTSGNTAFYSLHNLRSFVKFAIVGGVGVVINEGLLLALIAAGFYLLLSSVIAIEVSILTNFFMNDLWTFKDRRSGHIAVRLGKFNLLMLVGLVVNTAVLDLGTDYGMSAAVANLVGIGVAFIVRYLLSVKYAWTGYAPLEQL